MTIPSTVTWIGAMAFSRCSGLINVVPENLNYSGKDGVLFNKTQTELIQCTTSKEGIYTIPSTVTSVKDGAFYYCTGLIDVVLPSSLISIGGSAFYCCKGLNNLSFPSSLTFIRNSSYSYCTGLISISIPSSVSTIEDNAFGGASGMITVDPNNPNYSSSNGALLNKTQTEFIHCPVSMENYIIPSTVTNIWGYAFVYCEILQSVIIPPSVTRIGHYAFQGCNKLTTLTIPAWVTTIETDAFSSCTHLTSIYANPLFPVDVSTSFDVFWNSNISNCWLYVPIGSKNDYKAANQWKDFPNIEEMNGLYISTNKIGLKIDADSSIVTIASSVNWTATSDQSWLTLIEGSGTIGRSTVKLSAPANPNPSVRTATVTVKASGYPTQTISVTQATTPPIVYSLKLSNKNAWVDRTEGSYSTITITSNTSWTASSDYTWLTVSPLSGTGNGTITLTATLNKDTTQRFATVTVVPVGAETKTISVTQAQGEATLSVSQYYYIIGAEEGSTGSIEVTSNSTWTTNSNQSWLTVNPAKATGNGTVNFTVSKNNGERRQAYLCVDSYYATIQCIIIYQDPIATLSLSSNTASIAWDEGSTSTINVTSNVSWTASSDQTWLTVNPSTGTGNGTLTLTAAANTSINTRTANVTVLTNGLASGTIVVTQAAGSTSRISTFEAGAINIFPNPAINEFLVSGIHEKATLTLIDINGKVYIKRQVVDNESISIAEIPCGFYLVTLQMRDGLIVRKLVKE